MTKEHLGATTPAVAALLDGSDPAGGVGLTVELTTSRPADRLGVALLSVGEVLVTAPQEWRLALHAGSSTAAALGDVGATALATLVADGAHHSHDLRVRRTWPLTVAGQQLLGVVADVTDVVVDTIGYAVLESGITYRLTAPDDDVVRRWTETITALERG